jgi:hypothetical protein
VSRPRLLAATLALHDVRDVEAHVRALLDSRLAGWGARLDSELYDDALTFLVTKCWELSGIDENGHPRSCWYARLYESPDEIEAGDEGRRIGPYQSQLLLDLAIERNGPMIAEPYTAPPPGAYDPTIGLAFSTYSRRVLSSRVVDWYRQTFGDARYGTRIREVSLDAPRRRSDSPTQETADDATPGLSHDRPDPAAGQELEEVLTRVALAR